MISSAFSKEFFLKLFTILIVPAFIFSKALITICLISIIVLASVHYSNEKLKHFVKAKQYSLFVLLFAMILLSGINSDNLTQWSHHLNIKLPFLFLPLAFFLLPRISETWVISIHMWLIIVLSVSAIPVLINFIGDFQRIMDGMGQGHPIPTPVEHVKYSMMNAYAVVSGVIILRRPSLSWHGLPKQIIGILVLFLAIYMHILAVRTGLFILYASGIIWVGSIVIKHGRLGFGLTLLVSMGLIISVAIFTIPSLSQRIGYMQYDLQQYKTGKGNWYSDSDRLQSYKVGWDLFVQSPFVGTGIGDLRDVGSQVYSTQLNRPNYHKYPHSQFLFVLAGCGLLGIIIFVVGFYGPLIVQQNYSNPLLFYLYLNYSLSFLVENSLERSFSLAFFLFFSLLLLSSKKN